MADRELLELAAKAAGYVLDADGDRLDQRDSGGGPTAWNPLTDDGDALRLAVRLRISPNLDYVSFSGYPAVCAILPRKTRRFDPNAKHGVYQEFLRADDTKSTLTEKAELVRGIESATRRAIVRAAAEIGKALP